MLYFAGDESKGCICARVQYCQRDTVDCRTTKLPIRVQVAPCAMQLMRFLFQIGSQRARKFMIGSVELRCWLRWLRRFQTAGLHWQVPINVTFYVSLLFGV